MDISFGNFTTGCGNLNGGICADAIRITTDKADLDSLFTALDVAKIAPESYYTRLNSTQFSTSRAFLTQAKAAWTDTFDWQQQLDRVNTYQNFRTTISDAEGGDFSVHYVGVFSLKSSAIPIVLSHGWPGSFLEFLPLLDLLTSRYTLETLPYHIIVPSLPGYGYTTRDKEDIEITFEMVGRVINNLMIKLGFQQYIAQGGDVGSAVSSILGQSYAECIGIHLNFFFLTPEQNARIEELGLTNDMTEVEREHHDRANTHWQTGSAYMLQHGTRPSTSGLAMASSPLAILTWIGEKFLTWSDPRFPIDTKEILAGTTLYWQTDTFSRSLWPYRAQFKPTPAIPSDIGTALGVSIFPYEFASLPRSWADALFPNLVFYNTHDRGGHFAALENPEGLLGDLEEFVQIVGRRQV
ncbi:Epoxide hydrolase-like protein 5 [Elsinoe fawcettii]|nr:Epoxide hydrolase-like protein 5 [Elsinoe fawcettii]